MKLEITNSSIYLRETDHLFTYILQIAPSRSLFCRVPLWNSSIEADYRLLQLHTYFILHTINTDRKVMAFNYKIMEVSSILL